MSIYVLESSIIDNSTGINIKETCIFKNIYDAIRHHKYFIKYYATHVLGESATNKNIKEYFEGVDYKGWDSNWKGVITQIQDYNRYYTNDDKDYKEYIKIITDIVNNTPKNKIFDELMRLHPDIQYRYLLDPYGKIIDECFWNDVGNLHLFKKYHLFNAKSKFKIGDIVYLKRDSESIYIVTDVPKYNTIKEASKNNDMERFGGNIRITGYDGSGNNYTTSEIFDNEVEILSNPEKHRFYNYTDYPDSISVKEILKNIESNLSD